ncbi:MAG: nucleotidyltransferase family protein [Terracidiphilus sp.]
MNCAPVAAVVLAAGGSRRLGQPKQLLLLDGETLLGRTLRLVRGAGAGPVVVVLGAYAEEIRAAVPLEGFVAIENAAWEQGMAGSMRAGLAAVERAAPEAAGVLLVACDQPRLTAAHLRALREAFAAQAGAAIVASGYAGVAGVPALFPRAVFPRLLALEGDRGARALLAAPPCPLVTIPFDGGEMDIDTPTDLASLA